MKRLFAAISGTVLVALGFFLIFNNTDQLANTNTATPSEPIITTSIAQLINAGQPVACRLTLESTDHQDWTILTDGRRVRKDFSVLASPTDAWNGHVITNNDIRYVWYVRNGVTIAFQQPTSVDIANQIIAGTRVAADVDHNITYDMRCQAWSVDDSVFTAPTDITFKVST